VRPELAKPLEQAQARERLGLEPSLPTLLAFGGSQGARAINRLVPQALQEAAGSEKIQVLHLAGPKGLAEALSSYEGASFQAKLLAALDEMQWAYAAADLVVCRAGASTLAELSAQSKPSILIPLPSAAGAHQEANARLLEKAGAACLVLEEEAPRRLAPLLRDLLFSKQAGERRLAMAQAHSRLGLPPPEEAPLLLARAVEEAAAPP